jgi:hypothetical protein
MTPEQIELARHALGLTNGRKVSFRNHYVAGEGGLEYVAWCDLVSRGLARGRKGSQMTGGDPVFWLTRAGAEKALKRGERLDEEDFPAVVSPAHSGCPSCGKPFPCGCVSFSSDHRG